MAFMAKHKEVSAEASVAMEQRFRPIAPKPMPPPMPIGATAVSNVQWRAQKRGRQDCHLLPHPMIKRERDMISSCPPPPIAWWATGDVERPMEAARGWYRPQVFLPSSCEEDLRRLSLNKGSFASPWAPLPHVERLFPIERDLISKLQVPKVIKPRPTRPKRTTIRIDCCSSNTAGSTNMSAEEVAMTSKKTPGEVEAELALPGALPAVVSGCNNNRVRLANDAYKKMVGQPLCPWLDSLPGATASRRINGEVVLYVQAFSIMSCLPSARCAFPCTAKISWEHEDGTALLTVPCVVERLTGNSNDYRFIWRFDSKRASLMYNLA